jgi:hypothetical protein
MFVVELYGVLFNCHLFSITQIPIQWDHHIPYYQHLFSITQIPIQWYHHIPYYQHLFSITQIPIQWDHSKPNYQHLFSITQIPLHWRWHFLLHLTNIRYKIHGCAQLVILAKLYQEPCNLGSVVLELFNQSKQVLKGSKIPDLGI